jgi:hypothetical protein
MKQSLLTETQVRWRIRQEPMSSPKTVVTTDITPKTAALTAGLGLLLMIAASIFAEVVRTNLMVTGDATATVRNIVEHGMLFRASILGYLVVIVLDIVVAWALYIFFKPANPSLSLLAGWLRIVYAAIFTTSVFHLLTATELLKTSDPTQVMLALNAFSDSWKVSLLFFGLHLGVLGYVALKSTYVPKFLGILLMVAGVGYGIDSIGRILIPDYHITLAIVTFIGELLLMVWLLIQGRKITLA